MHLVGYAQLPPWRPIMQTIEILPLTVSILETKWETIPGGVEGSGRGNVYENDSAVAFMFTTECEGSLALTTKKVADRGRWQQKGESLQLVGQGDDGTVRRHCFLHTKLNAKLVYLMDFGTGEMTTQSQGRI